MISLVKKIVGFFESSPINVVSFGLSFILIVAVRIILEAILKGHGEITFPIFFNSVVLGTFLFFLLAYLIFLVFLIKITGEKLKKVASFLLWGQWLIILPPVIDHFIFGDQPYYSFYLFNGLRELLTNYLTFFGDRPDFGMTYGPRFLVLVTTLFLGGYIALKKKSWFWWLGGMVLVYTILFFLGSVPSWITLVVNWDIFLTVRSHTVASLFATPLRFFGTELVIERHILGYKLAPFYGLFMVFFSVLLAKLTFWKEFKIILKNARFPQLIYHTGLFLLGFLLASFYFPQNIKAGLFEGMMLINLWLAIILAWLHSVLLNDLNDLKIDQVSNLDRPLVKNQISWKQYHNFNWAILGLALILALTVEIWFFFLILVYLLLSYGYSVYPFRLKRVVFLSSVVAAFSSLLVLIAGYTLVADDQSLKFFPWLVINFLLVAYVLILPLKDLKDIQGDQKEKVVTLANLLGEERARLLLGGLLFVAFVSSVWLIGVPALFWPALILGLISFWVVNERKIKRDRLLFWVLGLVALYGIILVLRILS